MGDFAGRDDKVRIKDARLMLGNFSRILICLLIFFGVYAKAAPELPLWAAASWRNDVQTVKAHIIAGTDVETIDDWTGKTAMHYAAEYGNLEIAQLLIDAGANIQHRDFDKATALHHAAIGGFVDVVKLLLVHGADINAKDKSGETAMDGVAFFGHTNVADLLKSYYGIIHYDLDNQFKLEATALAPGWYGFLNKKMKIEPRKFQILSSENLINWRVIKILDFTSDKLVFKDTNTSKYRQRFYRMMPFTQPPPKNINRIDIKYDYYEAKPINGILDGVPSEWLTSEMIANPGFEVVDENQRGKSNYIAGETTYSQFAEFNEGKWEGDNDHGIKLGIGWRATGLHLTLVVEDDQHVHFGKSADEGDAVKILFTNAGRNEVLGEFVFAFSYDAFLKDPDWKMVNDMSYDKKMLSSPGFVPPIGYMEQLQGDAGFDVVMRRNQKTIDPATGDPATGTTVYEFWFAPETVGVSSLEEDVSFGLGVAVIDSDLDAPGIQGWSGWGPESVLFEAKPSEAATIILVDEPENTDGGGQ